MTKSYRIKKNICGLLSFLCAFGPLVVFIIMGLLESEKVDEKLCLTLTSIASIMLGLIAAMRKIHLKSTVYVAMIGLWIALENIIPFIITLGVCTILDELIFTPLHHRFKEDYHTHKQIDKRLKQ